MEATAAAAVLEELLIPASPATLQLPRMHMQLRAPTTLLLSILSHVDDFLLQQDASSLAIHSVRHLSDGHHGMRTNEGHGASIVGYGSADTPSTSTANPAVQRMQSGDMGRGGQGGKQRGDRGGDRPRQCKLIARGASQLGLAVRAIHQNWACKANKSEVRYLLRQPPQQPAPI